jgi:hypothetical protein
LRVIVGVILLYSNTKWYDWVYFIALNMPITALQRFGDLDLVRGERVIFRTHAYFIAFVRDAIPGIVGVFIGLLLYWFFSSLLGFGFSDGLEVSSFVFFIAGIPFLWGLYVLVKKFIDWQFDEAVITNKRVIFMDHTGLFDRGISSADHNSIRDVMVHQSGLLRSLFRVGTIDVKTSASASDSEGKTLIIRDVYHPRRLHKLIDLLSSHPEMRERSSNDLLMECGLMVLGDLGKEVKKRVKMVMKRKK